MSDKLTDAEKLIEQYKKDPSIDTLEIMLSAMRDLVSPAVLDKVKPIVHAGVVSTQIEQNIIQAVNPNVPTANQNKAISSLSQAATNPHNKVALFIVAAVAKNILDMAKSLQLTKGQPLMQADATSKPPTLFTMQPNTGNK